MKKKQSTIKNSCHQARYKKSSKHEAVVIKSSMDVPNSSRKDTDFEAMYSRLVKLPLFESFHSGSEHDKSIMRRVCTKLKVMTFESGQNIITEGNIGKDFFILYEGSVHITKKTISGDVIALAKLNSSQNIFFGESALISDESRTATVVADSECTVLVLNRDDFDTICETEPLIGYRVVLCLARRMTRTIRKTNEDISILYEALFNEIDGNI